MPGCPATTSSPKDGDPNPRRNHADDEINEGRERIAMKMATLGAIEAGVIPAALLRELLDRLPEVRQDAP